MLAAHQWETSYSMRLQLRQDLGIHALLVFDVLAHHADVEGEVEMPHDQVATETGLGRTSVRQAIGKLVDTSWIKREHQMHDGRDRANLYRIPTHILGALTRHPGVATRHAIRDVRDIRDEEVVGSSTSIDLSQEFSTVTDPGGHGCAVAAPVSDYQDLVVSQERGSEGSPVSNRVWTMPESLGRPSGRFNPFTTAESLAAYFGSRITSRDGKRIPRSRWDGWIKSARFMARKDLGEVCDILDWMFDEHHGDNPISGDRITSLYQVSTQYDALRLAYRVAKGEITEDSDGTAEPTPERTPEQWADLARRLAEFR